MDEDPTDNSAKWVLGTKCIADIYKPLLPPQVLFGHFCEIKTPIWTFEELLDLCFEFVTEIRLMALTITMRNITEILQKLKNLRTLTMSCGRSETVWEPIAEVLKCTTQINELIIEYMEHDFYVPCPMWDKLIELGTPLTSIFINAGKLIGCKQFSKLLATLQLRELTLRGVEFENDAEMTDFFESLSTNRTLDFLDLEIGETYLSARIEMVVNISKLISSAKSNITHLYLTTALESQIVIHLCEALQSNTCIQTLCFKNNPNFDSTSTTALVDLLSHNTTLTNLTISDCKLGYRRFQNIVTGLTSSKISNTLRVLDLSYNLCRALGAEHWGKLRTCCTSLVKLNLEGNKIGDKIRDSFLELLRSHPSLTSINLSVNKLGDAGLLKLLPILTQNTMLQVIGLRGNMISADGANAIAAAFTNRDIRSLDLQRNPLGPAHQIRQMHEIKKLRIGYDDERVFFD
eukprot:Phypoly_transcript_08239.p1 GENE.Phypoly_transcript_08239~~Phypoly_transcript_08239.p1  ORF type:complete len:510 (+),score=58.34 Phypoly_transcript_08239:150-1532(+)